MKSGKQRRVAAMVAAGVAAVAFVSPATAGELAAPPAGLIWAANPGMGISVFQGVEEAPGTVAEVPDPTGRFGLSYRFETNTNNGVKSRCESRGLRLPDGSVYTLDDSKVGQTFYVGWRALWNPMPDKPGAWVALYQLHLDGAPTKWGVYRSGVNTGVADAYLNNARFGTTFQAVAP